MDGHQDDEPESPLEGVKEPSLSELSQAFAEAMGKSLPDPSPDETSADGLGGDPDSAKVADDLTEPTDDAPATDRSIDSVADDAERPVSPKSILEAILFVGHPENQPITSRMVADVLRGVEPNEVDDLVVELNADYEADELGLQVRSVDGGYRMELADRFEPVRQRFFGRVRHARLSRAAVDVMAVVAYNQPITRQRVDKMLGGNCGRILSQLVRRQLLAQQATGKPREREYVTTDRFLELFELSSTDDLPRSEEPQ